MSAYKSLNQQNKNRVIPNDPADICYWKIKFHCSEEELIHAASVAGCSSNDLEKFLATKPGH